jgi:glutamate-ammonia-ligase adenylyltransferase
MTNGKTELERAIEHAFESDDAPLLELLPHYGLHDARRALKIIRGFPNPKDSPWLLDLLPRILREVNRTPDPVMSLNNWERFMQAAIDPYSLYRWLDDKSVWIEILSIILSQSQFLADVLVRNPEVFDWLNEPMTLYSNRTEEYYQHRAREVTAIFETLEKKQTALCRWQRLELFRIGARDILRAARVEQITTELSLLAESIIERTLDLCLAEAYLRYGMPRLDPSEVVDDKEQNGNGDSGDAPLCQMSVYAMGKLGGRELNFSSDVDLIFVYEGEGETDGLSSATGAVRGRISNHVFFTKVCEQFIRFLSQRTAEGILYRVDVRLRPEGNSGPLIRSFDAYENYFFTQGRIWERAAYIKARAVAGSEKLARRFYNLISGFVFSPESPERLRVNLAEIKRLIDGNIGEEGRRLDVKRGWGGIREIEFALSTLQLIHGGRQPALRARNFWAAADVLKRHGCLAEEQEKRLVAAYDFLRTIEHRLQIMAERQTHELPEGEAERKKLAMRLGFGQDVPEHKILSLFDDRLNATRAYVHKFYLTTLDAVDEEDVPPEQRVVHALYSREPDLEVLLARLAPFGFDKKATAQCLLDMVRGNREIYVSSRGQRLFRQVLPHILEECQRVPYPDDAIRNLDTFLDAAKGVTSYYSLFLESIGVRKLILRLFGTSNYCARILSAKPELFDSLLEWGLPVDVEYADTLKKYFYSSARSMKDDEDRLNYLRLFKQQEWLKIVLRDLFVDNRDEFDLSGQLTALAELCLDVAANIAFERASEKFHLSEKAHDALSQAWMIAGLGSFGGLMLSYFSDLDVIFVYDPPEDREIKNIDLAALYSGWAYEIINIMSRSHPKGDLFKTDARLRPEGRSAPIVAPLERYVNYYAKNAQTWEFQTALKYRRVAGNEKISNLLQREIHKGLVNTGRGVNLNRDIRSMRERLEQSVKLPDWAQADFKRGRGGLVDIDFIVQFLLLKNAEQFKAIPPDTPGSLMALSNAKVLPAADANTLNINFIYLKKLEARIRLMDTTTEDFLPVDRGRLRSIASSLNLLTEEDIIEKLQFDFENICGSNRALFERYTCPEK